MYGRNGGEDNDYSCTLGFKSNDTILGLMTPTGTSQSNTWTRFSLDPYPGSFTNGPIYYIGPLGYPFPPTPFAWAFVQGGGDSSKSLPIYGSIAYYSYYDIDNTVDAYLVLPGFCLITFQLTNWDVNGSQYIYDNTNGSNYLYVNNENQNNSSCLLFYKGLTSTNLLGLQSIVFEN
jgi:hypothetical protein